MRSLEEFDKDAISDAVIKKLKRYIDDPSYTPGERPVGQKAQGTMLGTWSGVCGLWWAHGSCARPGGGM